MPFGGMDPGNFEEGQDRHCEDVASAPQDMSCWWWKGKGKGKGKKGKHCGKHFKGHGKFECNQSKVEEEQADIEQGSQTPECAMEHHGFYQSLQAHGYPATCTSSVFAKCVASEALNVYSILSYCIAGLSIEVRTESGEFG